MLSPLSQSEYPVKNAKEINEQFKNVSAPENSKLASSDVSSRFTKYLLTIQ